MKRTLTVLILVATATAAEAGSCGEFTAEYACRSNLDSFYENQRIITESFHQWRMEDAIRDSARRNAYTPPPVDTSPPSWNSRTEWRELPNGTYEKRQRID
jgi:hypothetical protein